MWTKKEIVEFKDAIRKEGGDAVIKVGHGETVTVRVPTHDEGTALFWEFATDSYDIAFGLFFEWNKAPEETEVSVHVSDSEDEDLDEEYLGGWGGSSFRDIPWSDNTMWSIWSDSWVGLTMICDVPSSCPLAQPVLPISHQPEQNQADGGKVNPSQLSDHPVVCVHLLKFPTGVERSDFQNIFRTFT